MQVSDQLRVLAAFTGQYSLNRRIGVPQSGLDPLQKRKIHFCSW
jgi:hypothetical protein